ncbi:CPBP family intramembrane glutamic endopeptidase [Kordiimonas sp. SCSIO 12610]|uniref:CPBP family intramembrane glutamic endopeptidase n=1 Tax=Kordiimonas sp. SCSIO 12610 TaxID=2829597 RepID=UPI00210A3F4A|nr:CPBP family glutamic-type intramembrane protease [Kordiimonas sp. SCSIO 12610]UTW56049.1 CPBP family intramembrane metalloprotease [Kordiimonas sp. SCSIO 12610]
MGDEIKMDGVSDGDASARIGPAENLAENTEAAESTVPAERTERDYLTQTDYGRNKVWQWIIGVLFVAVIAIAGGIALGIVLAIGSTIFNGLGDFDDPNSYTNHLALLTSFVPIFIGFWVVQKYWHKRSWHDLMTGAKAFRWNLLLISGGLYAALTAVVTYVSLVVFGDADEVTWAYNGDTYWWFLLITLLFVPIQASTEEIMLRGYANQWFARYIPSRWIVYLITSALFASLHLANPEASEGDVMPYMLAIFSLGFIACILTHYTNGLEAAMGLHIFNNIFVFAVMSFELPDTPKTYLFSLGEIDFGYGDVAFEAVVQLVFVGILLKLFKGMKRAGENAV